MLGEESARGRRARAEEMKRKAQTRRAPGGCLRILAALATMATTGARAEPSFSEIDAFVQEQIDADGIPGLGLAIIQSGQIVHTRGFGRAGPTGQPVTPRTPFLLDSLRKSFTAVAVMQQVEAGRLELDSPVQRYLPWFRLADDTAVRGRARPDSRSGRVARPGSDTRGPATSPHTLVSYLTRIELKGPCD